MFFRHERDSSDLQRRRGRLHIVGSKLTLSGIVTRDCTGDCVFGENVERAGSRRVARRARQALPDTREPSRGVRARSVQSAKHTLDSPSVPRRDAWTKTSGAFSGRRRREKTQQTVKAKQINAPGVFLRPCMLRIRTARSLLGKRVSRPRTQTVHTASAALTERARQPRDRHTATIDGQPTAAAAATLKLRSA